MLFKKKKKKLQELKNKLDAFKSKTLTSVYYKRLTRVLGNTIISK